MTRRMEHRFEVTFATTEAPDGRTVIALGLNQEGQAAAGQDHTFFLDVDPAIAQEAAPRLAALLNEYVTGFGVMLPLPDETQSPSQPEDPNATGALYSEVQTVGAVTPEEPEPNPREGQPISALQVDGVEERESTKDGDGQP
jgi:hypothetical protein